MTEDNPRHPYPTDPKQSALVVTSTSDEHRPDDISRAVSEISPIPGDLTHLHPGIRQIALADDTVRLQAIRTKRWITHHPASRVLASLQEALNQTADDRMENLLLVAESGMGKTMRYASSSATMPKHSMPRVGCNRTRSS